MAADIVFNADGSVTVPLTKGYSTTLDREDFERLFIPNQAGAPTVKWHAFVEPSGPVYVTRTEQSPKKRMRWMHREIIDAPAGLDVDHRDRNGLNNRRSNLRVATRGQNLANRTKRGGTKSRFKGVYWDAGRQKWQAIARVRGRNHHLGRFDDEVTAARAYNELALAEWGEFAALNDISP